MLEALIIVLMIAPAIFWFPRPSVKECQPVSTPNRDVESVNRARCPDCGDEALLAGPSGGVSQNVGCNSCLMEFNVHHGVCGAFKVDRTGRMSKSRAGVFGISPEEYDGLVAAV